MNKEISVTALRSNLAFELDHLCKNKNNRIIIKRPKGNIVMLSLNEFNSMNETLYLLSTKENRDHIFESIKQSKEGKLRKIILKDLWK
jgi:antitoxin YefM